MEYASNNIIRIIFLFGWILLGPKGFGDIVDITMVDGQETPIYFCSYLKGTICLSDQWGFYCRGKEIDDPDTPMVDESKRKLRFTLHGTHYRATLITAEIDRGEVIFEKYIH